jgi:molybdopterin-guanine dinucleotide biosynthesis protein A
MQKSDTCAVILAGGKSSRMGINKALLDFGGKPLIEVLVDRIRPLTDQIFISSNDASCYEFLDLPVISDRFRGHGPLAGLHSAMLWKRCAFYIALACDLPNLQLSLLRKLASVVEGYDAAIPRTSDGAVHPLCAVYSRTCLPALEDSLLKGTNRILTVLESSLSIRWVDPGEGRFKDADLANINTPEDLQRLKGPASLNLRLKLNM